MVLYAAKDGCSLSSQFVVSPGNICTYKTFKKKKKIKELSLIKKK